MRKYTDVGTDIELVKQQNANSGMSYNEAKEYLARTTGGQGTAKFSTTNIEEIKRQIRGKDRE
ncbi:gamma-type small acid-soluble spore protein [Bacillus sp. B15-48]|uniref:gamma-type small acid-soluble spore protein n=1 Tax=Bacillus sp. B15-48 TaxID=1548601 RepID=UPI00193F4A8B|nr:gamma-type small acid-soluble spore protein [Bacillus sp. B15-48]MBM4763606.1 gamma-type small acid-soluble spore protein [Bacillus sp. B15-48]